jgi:RNA polymerase sigma-70 factor (ECF subfamily)
LTQESDSAANDLAQLMQRAQAGDAAAYAVLLYEITPLLRREIRRRQRFAQPQDVEDLVQDVLLSLHAVRATYDSSRPFLPWLMAIAHNRIVDGIRRQVRRRANEVTVDELPETFPEDATNRSNEGYGDAEALRQAMQQLPRGQRTAIELVKMREMSLKEASAASGMSVAALKVAVHRGIGALRRAMNAGGKP